MRIAERAVPAVPDPALAEIRSDISGALQSVTANDPVKFVVNPTVWFQEKSNGKAKPCVMNLAAYIPRTFEGFPKKNGWTAQKKLKIGAGDKGQKIDAFKEFPATSIGFSLTRDSYLERRRE